MSSNDKLDWKKAVVVSLLILIPIAAVITLLFLLNKGSRKEITINNP